ncbi:ABC transporter ATP-binding protein [Candidatus Hydrogenedentota bacterium]
MNDPVVQTNGLTKTFGSTRALDGLDLKVPQGCVYGMLGPNGAGKTTTMRILMGLFKADSGSATILGENSWGLSPKTKERIAYLSESQTLFENWKVFRAVQFHSSFFPTWDQDMAERILEKLEIPPKERIKALSKGKKRGLALALAVSQRPELMLLDEPAGGLDVETRRDFLNTVLDLVADQTCTVVFSSHILSDVERVADWIGIIKKGRMRIAGQTDDLKTRVKKLRLSAMLNEDAISNMFNIVRLEREDNATLVTADNVAPELIERATREWDCSIETYDLGLEQIYLEYTAKEKELVE